MTHDPMCPARDGHACQCVLIQLVRLDTARNWCRNGLHRLPKEGGRCMPCYREGNRKSAARRYALHGEEINRKRRERYLFGW